jgi:hypothetical protein
MYTINTCFVKKDFEWDVAAIEFERIELLLADYQRIRVVVDYNYQGVSTQKMIDLTDNKGLISPTDRKRSLTEWITSLKNDSLVGVTDPIYPASAKSVMMRDSFFYQLKIDVGNHKFGPGNTLPYGEDKDLIITSNPKVKTFDKRHVVHLKDNALFCVNGQICRHYWNYDQIYLIDGHRKINGTRDNVISVIDFTDIGGFDIVDLKDSNVKVAPQSTTDKKLQRTRAIVTLPKVVSGYTPILVLDGQMHILDGSYKIVADNQILINIDHMAAIKKALRYPFNRLDWLDPANVLLTGIRADHFYTQEFLTQTDSFIVMVKTSELSLKRESMSPTGLHGCYTHYRMPKGIMFFEDYTLAPYMTDGHTQYTVSLQTIDNRRMNWALWSQTNNSKVLPTTTHTERGKAPLMDAFVIELYVF